MPKEAEEAEGGNPSSCEKHDRNMWTWNDVVGTVLGWLILPYFHVGRLVMDVGVGAAERG